MMPEDGDGVWSEMSDHSGSYGDSYDLNDIWTACRAYLAFLASYPAQQAETSAV